MSDASKDSGATTSPGWTLQNARAAWSNLRAVYMAAGLVEGVAKVDTLMLDDRRALYARSTWDSEVQRAITELNLALRETKEIPVRELATLLDADTRAGVLRFEQARSFLATPRGESYLQFLLWAQIHLRDGQLALVSSLSSLSVTSGVAPEHHEARIETDPERRAHLLAAAISTTLEGYYKPILKAVWTLSAHVAGEGARTCPKECGRVMDQCEHLWKGLPHVPNITEFLDRDAVQVRNAVAHRSLAFDSATGDLIIQDDQGRETVRLAEAELRRRFGELFSRARTMHLAYFTAVGELDAKLSVLGSAAGAGS